MFLERGSRRHHRQYCAIFVHFTEPFWCEMDRVLPSVMTSCTYIFFSNVGKRMGISAACACGESKWKKKRNLASYIIFACLSMSVQHINFFCQCFISMSGLFQATRNVCKTKKIHHAVRWPSSPDFCVKLIVWSTAYNSEPWAVALNAYVITCNVMQCCSKVNCLLLQVHLPV